MFKSSIVVLLVVAQLINAAPEWPSFMTTHPCATFGCSDDEESVYSVLDQKCQCTTMALQPRQAVDAVHDFIPPPKQDITPELIQQALSAQPQNTAVISSMVAYFLDGVIRTFLQLTGPVPYTLAVNCSTSLPCGTIGMADPQPNVAVVPVVMNAGQGAPQTVVANCEIIGVNIYDAPIITFWVQKLDDGSVYSVVGNNIVADIDKMNTTESTALTLTTQTSSDSKRSTGHDAIKIKPEKRQM